MSNDNIGFVEQYIYVCPQMVHVVPVSNPHFYMDDKMSGVEEKKNDADFLPSMGLGALLTNADDAKNLMTRIRHSDGMTLPADNRAAAQKARSAATTFHRIDDPLREGTTLRPKHPQQEKTSTEPKPGPSREPDFPYEGKFTSKTTPIETSTINMEHLTGMSEFEIHKTELYDVITKLPELHVTPAEYTRFRYASERPEKGKKVRQYEMDEDKRFVADVRVTNYQGSATVIIHCVDGGGKLHPYHLDGDDCFDGVYYKRMEFSPKSTTLRILKTTVIQPKAKEYKKSVEAQKAFLLQNKAIDGTEEVCINPLDKQCVHFHIKVHLDDSDSCSYLSRITGAIRNKKDGNEFKIYCITPPSATATGKVLEHLGERVHIIVTNETAFPKEVAVVLRHKEIAWEKELSGNEIKVLKKAVVEFIPPPYEDTSITENVTVDVCLKDRTTGKETPPTEFIYIRDEYGLNAKRTKKRKLDDLEELFQSNYSDPNCQAQKKFLPDLSTGALQTSVGSSSSDEETPHNSLGFENENSMIYDQNQPEHAGVQNFDKDVSLGEQRTNKSGNLLQQTATVMDINTGASYTIQLENEGNIVAQPGYDARTSGQAVTLTGSINNPSSHAGGGPSSIAGEQSLLPQVQEQSVGNPSNFNPDIIRQLSPDMLIRLANMIQDKKVQLIPESEELVWQLVLDLLPETSQNVNSAAQVQNVQLPSSNQQPAQAVQSLSELPDLPPDYQYAIIQGQIMVVKNDLQEANQSALLQTTNMQGQNNTIIIQQSSQQAQTNFTNTGDFSQNVGEQASSTLGGASGSFVQANQMAQPRQPPAAFWRATTGTSSNLDDDDVEIDAVVDFKNDTNESSNRVEEEEEIGEPKADSTVKTHTMKLRGKKINYRDTLLGNKELYADMEEDYPENMDGDINKPQRQDYTERRGKKSRGRGKALYEDDGGSNDGHNDDYDDGKEEEDYEVKNSSSRRYGKGSRGKDLKKMKKMMEDDQDDSSQGFDFSDDL